MRAGTAAALAAVAGAYLAGYRLAVVRVGGGAKGKAALEFGGGGEPGRLRAPPGSEVRNVVLLIGDGLGFGHLAAARAEIAGPDGRLFLEGFPVTGWVTTHSARQMVTESAAAATALATGEKTDRGRIALSLDGRPLKSVAEAARDRGMAVGLVTSSYLTDATPAAFLAHVPSRRMRKEIARQMAAAGTEILLGEERGGLAASLLDGDAAAAFRGQGYAVYRSWEALEEAGEGRIVALLPAGSVADPSRRPELPAMAALALRRLGARPAGFFLMVEEEETDSGPHNRNLRRTVAGVKALDGVARLAVEFAQRDGRTLVVVTGDHETGGLTILGGSEGSRLGVRWATDDHTGAPVPLLAYGPGAERFAGVRDNTEIPRILGELLGAALP